MDMRERFLNALRGSAIDRMPAACPLQTGTLPLMKLTDSYWPEAHRDPERMAALSLAASQFAGMESARLPFDVVLDAEVFGAKVSFGTRRSAPYVTESPIASLEDFRNLDVPEVRDAGRVAVVDEAISIIRKKIPDLPVIVTIHAPFSLSSQLRGEEKAMLDLAARPELFRELVDFLARWSSFVASHFIATGADAVMMVDADAEDSILGPELYESFALPGQRKVAEAISEGGAPSILHICGDIRSTTELMVRSGVDALSIGQGMSLPLVKKTVDGRCRIIGNIDPSTVLLKGTPKQVYAEVKRCVAEGADIAAPACGLSPATPLENIQSLTDAVRKYGRRGE